MARWWLRLFWQFCGVVVLNDSYVMREGLGGFGGGGGVVVWFCCGVVMT